MLHTLFARLFGRRQDGPRDPVQGVETAGNEQTTAREARGPTDEDVRWARMQIQALARRAQELGVEVEARFPTDGQ